MKSFWKLFLVVSLTVFLAAPALAEHSVGGFYRAKGWVSNYQSFNFGNLVTRGRTFENTHTNAYVEQRARLKYVFSNNEYAKVIFYIEADNVWGDLQFNRAGATRNSGGGLGADTVAIEIKNLYTWFKIPDTTFQFQVGLQNFNDAYYGNFEGVNDTGGIIGKAKFDPVNFRFGWLKFSEGNTSQGATNKVQFADDLDFYLVEAKFKVADNVNLGANVYFMDDNRNRADNQAGLIGGTPVLATGGSTTDLWILGVNYNLKFDPVTLTGFVAYQTGSVDSTTGASADRDISAFGANVRADAKLGPGNGWLEVLYLSGDDDSTDNDIEGWQVSPGINAPFYYRADMQILFYNGDDETTATGLFTDGNQGGNADGRGVIAVLAGFKTKLSDALVGKIGAGWAQDAEGNKNGSGLNTTEKSGFEVNGYLNYQVTKGLTAGVYAAYASLSDVPATLDNTKEADDLWMGFWRVQYKF